MIAQAAWLVSGTLAISTAVDGLLVMEFRSRNGAESFERTILARGIGFGSEAQKQ